jgi:hypothetical protein
MVNITSQHVIGFVVGLGASALGFYLYKKNQDAIDDFLRGQGLNIPTQGIKKVNSMTLEDLVAKKERLEDIIAEREMAIQEPAQPL